MRHKALLNIIPAVVVAGLCSMIFIGQEHSNAQYRKAQAEPVPIETTETTTDYFAYLDETSAQTHETGTHEVTHASSVSKPTEAKISANKGSLPCVGSIKTYELSDNDRYLIEKMVMAEAGNQSLEGKALVARVILNRMESPSFPDNIEGVIYEPAQFSPIDDGRFYQVEPDKSCTEAVGMVLAGWDESGGATYFATPEAARKWHHEALEYLFTYGGHDFFKEPEQI